MTLRVPLILRPVKLTGSGDSGDILNGEDIISNIHGIKSPGKNTFDKSPITKLQDLPRPDFSTQLIIIHEPKKGEFHPPHIEIHNGPTEIINRTYYTEILKQFSNESVSLNNYIILTVNR